MRVILKKDIPELGAGGEIVEVKDGYARNYLIPRGLVQLATTRNVKQLKHDQEVIESKIKKDRATATDLATRIENISCTIAKRVGENDRLFGSVTSKEIEECLREEGLVIKKRHILLEQPIKELGVFEVPIKLHHDITPMLKVWVVAK